MSAEPPDPTTSRLVSRDGSDRVTFSVALTIGRQPTNDLVLDHAQVSTHHAILEWEGARWRVKDLGSRNGTSLNHRRISAPRTLKEGDLLRFAGQSSWRVERLVPPAATEACGPTETVDHQRTSTEVNLYLAFTASDRGTIRVSGPGGDHQTETGNRFLLLYLLGRAGGAWVPDDQVKVQIWGRPGLDQRDPSILYKLVHDTRRMLAAWGLPGGLLAKSRGRTRLCLAPERIHLDETGGASGTLSRP